jgi:hypothetical protein
MKAITLFAILTLASSHQSLLLASAADQQTGDKEALLTTPRRSLMPLRKATPEPWPAFGPKCSFC